ncbi:MAG: hypothetical protein GF383_07380 [Candidatus Lokiarchaeota archaeon]|nr:hypothetical protein [Candidatus Lokiarchaeota archaeon]
MQKNSTNFSISLSMLIIYPVVCLLTDKYGLTRNEPDKSFKGVVANFITRLIRLYFFKPKA